ncbi:hypothetical protein UlMin_023419 [Ulmus minor]
MAVELSASDDIDDGSVSSDELDHVPLMKRRRIFLENNWNSCLVDQNGSTKPLMSRGDVKEVKNCDEPEMHPSNLNLKNLDPSVYNESEVDDNVDATETMMLTYVSLLPVGDAGGSSSEAGASISCTTFEPRGEVGANVCTLIQNSTLSEVLAKVKVEYPDNLLCSSGNGVNSLSGGEVSASVINGICDHFGDDQLDHIVLKERQRRLLSRKLLGSDKPVLEGSSEALSKFFIQQSAEGKQETGIAVEPLQGGASMELSSCKKQDNGLRHKIGINGSLLSTSVRIKDEPWDANNCHSLNKNAKTETNTSDEVDGDDEEHMGLGDQVKLLRSGDDSELSMSKNYEWLKNDTSGTESSPVASEYAKPFGINRPRKRKKTATDSVETALEEDAPGLLRVLVEKGVLVNEIKLYGEMESNEALDESSNEESFSELEAVLSKMFSERQSFMKFAPIRCTKGPRASYCLPCLISLVDQTKYLQFRKWPGEWGWCRDLHSFIFVFPRHNRLVLERPEYGFATYFFELLDSLPIEWQIKRLVTCMKLTNFSRVSLIEDKPLSVGEELTEGEAQVLMEYGWIPNTGLGRMLNYCDRVIHDKKSESDATEWRSKIAKLLMDGYNGGTFVATNIPKKVSEQRDAESSEIKLEI